MKLKLKEDPKEWRKTTLLTALALAVLSIVLRWRRILPVTGFAAALAVLGGVALCAVLRPGWFRGYYRFSSLIGFYAAQCLGIVALVVLFLFVLTPLGWALRLAGKDLLQLKPRRTAATYWHPTDESSPLDRLF
jgi:hypothetical protein